MAFVGDGFDAGDGAVDDFARGDGCEMESCAAGLDAIDGEDVVEGADESFAVDLGGSEEFCWGSLSEPRRGNRAAVALPCGRRSAGFSVRARRWRAGRS